MTDQPPATLPVRPQRWPFGRAQESERPEEPASRVAAAASCARFQAGRPSGAGMPVQCSGAGNVRARTSLA